MPDVLAVEAPRDSRRGLILFAALVVAGGVAVTLGVYGHTHDPQGRTFLNRWFTDLVAVKSWLATTAGLLASFQLFSALRMYGRIAFPVRCPSWLPTAHRVSGRLAFLFAALTAYNCLYAFGFQSVDGRRLVHSVAGCFFFGAFAAKLIVVRTRRVPQWAIPLAGASMFTALTVAWYTSAFWFFGHGT